MKFARFVFIFFSGFIEYIYSFTSKTFRLLVNDCLLLVKDYHLLVKDCHLLVKDSDLLVKDCHLLVKDSTSL